MIKLTSEALLAVQSDNGIEVSKALTILGELLSSGAATGIAVFVVNRRLGKTILEVSG